MFKLNKWHLFLPCLTFLILLAPNQVAFQQTSLSLPIGQETLKIEIAEDGIFTVTGADLQAAGLTVSQWNPQTITLMHRGERIATHFIGDNDAQFESDESIQFYGWAFDGSRHEKQFVDHNIFWLWSGDGTLNVDTIPNSVNGGLTHNWSMETIIIAPENDFFSGWTDQWHNFPNDPDAWYWDRIPQSGSGSNAQTVSYAINLPTPSEDGGDLTVTTEWMSRAKSSNPGSLAHTITVRLNGSASESVTWNGRKSINLTQTIPASELQTENNQLHVTVTSPDVIYLNQATFNYGRTLILDQSLQFMNSATQDLIVDVGNTAVSNLSLWHITDKYSPEIVSLVPNHLSGNQLRIGQTKETSPRFILQKNDTIKSPVSLEMYIPIDLTPTNQRARWLAISHTTFLPEAERLAAYRQTSDAFSTHVVDAEHIFNQFGHGFALPSAINSYLKSAYNSWQEAPQFVLLLGDATINPRQLDCQWSCQNSTWDAEEPTYLPTDLQFVDRFQGLIPTDQTMGMLDEDLIPDVMMGRIAAQTLAEAEAAVSKIMLYETAVSPQTHPSKNILFLADNADSAGDFCQQNNLTAQRLPNHQARRAFCLPADATPNDVHNIHQEMFRQINGQGSYLLNYRGHGSIQFWGGGDEILMSISGSQSTLGAWLNHIPTVIISADCLDGHFAWPGLPSISETLLTLQNSGTAAHWSSSGLGSDSEHSLMHQAFFEAFYEQDAGRIGEGIHYAQQIYAQSGLPTAPLYSFTLQGDPALKFDWVRYNTLFLPAVIRIDAS